MGMNELQQVQDWYDSQCNQDWEHSYGVKIDTLDNPGWSLEVDLLETELAGRNFESFSRGDCEEDSDWICCRVEQEKFKGSGGVKNLTELLRVFLAWAANAPNNSL